MSSPFQAARAKARAGVQPANKADGARTQDAGPMSTHGSAKKVGVPEVTAARDISGAESSNQHNYGTHREGIRQIKPGWGRP